MTISRGRRVFAVVVAACALISCSGGGDSSGMGEATDTGSIVDGAEADEAEASGDLIGADEQADGSTAPSADNVDAQSGGTLRIALQTEAGSLNPTNAAMNRGPIMLATAVFDTLVVLDENGDWHNNLTESWTPNDDFTSWEVRLRPGITFSDGLPLDAHAVVTTIEAALRDPLVSLVFKPIFAKQDAVEPVDELTFRLHTDGPNASLPLYFSDQLGMIGSPAWLEAAKVDPELDQFPVGAGPFVLEERVQDTRTVLVRNENWWRDDVEVMVDRIELYPVPQPSSRADQLLAGDVDLTHGSESLLIRQVRDAGDAVQRIEDNSGEELFLVMNAQRAPFDDIRVRQAATHLFPRADLLEFVDQGVSIPASSLFPPDSPWHDPTIVQLDDMADLAGPLVAAYCSDVVDGCTDGRIDIEYQSAVGQENDLIFDIVSDAMSDHFNITAQRVVADDHAREVIVGQYQMASWRFHGGTDPEVESVFLTCDTIGLVSLNFSRNCNESRDALIDQLRATRDFDERYAIWQQIQADLRDSYQYIIGTHTNWTFALGPHVGGLCDATSPEGVALPCQRQGAARLDQVFVNG